MKPSSNVPTSKRSPGAGSAIKMSPLKDTLKSGDTSTKREK